MRSMEPDRGRKSLARRGGENGLPITPYSRIRGVARYDRVHPTMRHRGRARSDMQEVLRTVLPNAGIPRGADDDAVLIGRAQDECMMGGGADECSSPRRLQQDVHAAVLYDRNATIRSAACDHRI